MSETRDNPGRPADEAAMPQKAGRRALLVSAVRYPVLAVLGVVGGLLISRGGGGRPVEEGQDCVNRGLCRGCSSLTRCGLPQADMARDVMKNGRRLG
jgi:hypothetical protein